MNGLPVNQIIHGDCLEVMKKLPKESIDSCVTDPPYGLGFMGKEWDEFTPKEYQTFSKKWGELVLQVLKPGAYLLAFSGTKTYHRMVTGLEDAGFVIRDQIDWLYGSGLPKGENISKAIDEHFGKEREITGKNPNYRPKSGKKGYLGESFIQTDGMKYRKQKPVTDEAKKWQGWETTLKPAHEPIVLAQKPKEGTYVNNVLKYGVGAMNIDECRINIEDENSYINNAKGRTERLKSTGQNVYSGKLTISNEIKDKGRFPTNLILDQKGAKKLDEQKKDKSRFFYCAKAHSSERNYGCENLYWKRKNGHLQRITKQKWEQLNKKERARGNPIATLKPINLMRYLVRLVTPPDGLVLDPFAGSGTTGIASKIEGSNYFLIEKRKSFANIIGPKRIEYWSKTENWDELKNHNTLRDVEHLKRKERGQKNIKEMMEKTYENDTTS